jgi:hypothetical protein
LTTPITVTPEMRQAVYAADCAEYGHAFETTGLFFGGRGTGTAAEFGNPNNPDAFPTVTCSRCRHVWVLLDSEGVDYEDAVIKLTGKVKDPEEAKPARGRKKPKP